MTHEEIFLAVRKCLAETLDVDEASIRRETRIVDELGADSLDLLEVTFNLEQRFKVEISPREIERRVRAELKEAPLEVYGVYTPEALAAIRRQMPEVPSEELSDGLRTVDLPKRLRVGTLVNLVGRLLGAEA